MCVCVVVTCILSDHCHPVTPIWNKVGVMHNERQSINLGSGKLQSADCLIVIYLGLKA